MKTQSARFTRKKGQLKIQEMSFMLLAIVLFFILVVLFWLAFQYQQMHEKANEIGKESAIMALNRISESPELGCGEPLCIDADKLMAIKGKPEYKQITPFSSMVVRKIYPGNYSDVECKPGVYPNCGFYQVFNKNVPEIKYETAVALCKIEKDELGVNKVCELAKLYLGVEKV